MYTTVCPPVRGDKPQALVSGLSPILVDRLWCNYFFTTYISIDLAHHEIFHAKVGKRGISNMYTTVCPPVRGDKPQALASGLSPLLVDKPSCCAWYKLDIRWFVRLNVEIVH